jgi:hypothetical protein
MQFLEGHVHKADIHLNDEIMSSNAQQAFDRGNTGIFNQIVFGIDLDDAVGIGEEFFPINYSPRN